MWCDGLLRGWRGVYGLQWGHFVKPVPWQISLGLRGCMWFDFGCSNDLHGYRPDTNDCGLFKVTSLKSHANINALNMWWVFHVSGVSDWVLPFSAGLLGRASVTCRIARLTPFRRCCATEAENHHANPVTWHQFRESGPQPSTYPPFMDICFTSCATGQIHPSTALPANILCIWTVNCGPPPL